MNLDAEKVLGRFAQAGAVRIHYGEAGSGPPVVCLHGTGPGADAWANFRLNAGALADHHRLPVGQRELDLAARAQV